MRRVAVVGGGIAGLTAALALARHGVDVTLLERADPVEPIGAGIQVSPNAMKVMRLLGLERALNATASAPREIVLRDGYSGAALAAIPLGPAIERRHGAPYLTVHRGDLQAVLLDAARHEPRVDIRTGAEVVRCGEDGTVHHSRGRAQFDLVVGADGVRSAVRSAVQSGRVDLSGATAWRANVPTAALPRTFAGPRTGVWLGAEGHVVHYPIRSGMMTNVVCIVPGEGGPEKAFRSWSLPLRELLGRAERWAPWPTPRTDPMRPWSRDRIVLIGDAAHAMWPYAAQGGAMAIEDGWTLAVALAERGQAAIEAWEVERRGRVARVAALADRNRRIYHARGPIRVARNVIMRGVPVPALMRAMDSVYSWDPPAKRSRPKASD